jgi:hypothetical protein
MHQITGFSIYEAKVGKTSRRNTIHNRVRDLNILLLVVEKVFVNLHNQ